MAADGAGNLYVTDSQNHTIRKVVLSTGAVTTLAGTARMTGSADGTGAAARFNRPSGVAADGAGNLYVADSQNHTIRKVVLSTGAVTTLAGAAGMSGSVDGTGAAARFNVPSGVTVDGAGNLYVAGPQDHTIRKVVLSTGAVTTLAGSAGSVGSADGAGTAARFNYPCAVAADGAGNVYVADTQNHTIRKVLLSTGTVTTLAGSAGMQGSADSTGAAARFNYPYGVSADSAGNVYVADRSNFRIRRVVVSTGAVTTLAGSGMTGSVDGTGAAAQFNVPLSVVAVSTGNIYVADSYNHTVRKIEVSTGAVTTLAGTAGMNGSTDGTGTGARFFDPFTVAVDGAGNLFIADHTNQTIRKVVVSTGAVMTIAGTAGMIGSTDGMGATARFYYPYGIAIDATGNVYVSDSNNHTIRKVVVSTGAVMTIAGTAGMIGSTDGMGAAARFNYPSGVAVDGAGNIYVSDGYNHTIRKVVVSTGAVTTLAGTAGIGGSADGTGTAALFFYPYAVAVDGANNLYVADRGSHTIRRVVASTGAVTTIAGTAGMIGSADGTGGTARFNSPNGVATDGAGNLYVADRDNHTIRKIDLGNAVVTTIAGIAGQAGVKLGMLPGRLNLPIGVAVSPTREIFFSGENAILAIR